jgi:hypothetical protein
MLGVKGRVGEGWLGENGHGGDGATQNSTQPTLAKEENSLNQGGSNLFFQNTEASPEMGFMNSCVYRIYLSSAQFEGQKMVSVCLSKQVVFYHLPLPPAFLMTAM